MKNSLLSGVSTFLRYELSFFFFLLRVALNFLEELNASLYG